MASDTPAPAALDALLAEVNQLDAIATPQPWEGAPDLGCVGYTYPQGGKFTVLAPPNPYGDVGKANALLAARYRTAAPRLAAIVRVLREAVKQAASFGEGPVVGPEFDCPYHAMEARHALARAEAIARGDS